jgi:ABC-2 type transport system ATP-binding protein
MIGDGWVRIHTSSEETTASLMRLLVNSGVTSVRTSRPSLEEVYLQVIGDRGLTV